MTAELMRIFAPDEQAEINRLTAQDAIMTHMMGGKRVLAPMDFKRPNLQILDSGTNDGLFLREIQKQLTAEPYTLLGYDIMPSFFPATTPPHTKFGTHDIANPWPAELQGSCDLVHQRLTLPGGVARASTRDIIKNLCGLVKPGGWIQLGEMGFIGRELSGPAMLDFYTMVDTFFQTAAPGIDPEYATLLAGLIKEQGFENVKQENIEIQLGATCKDPKIGAESTRSFMLGLRVVFEACKIMKVDVSEKVMEKLPERVEKELGERGGRWHMVTSFGQKPSA